MRIRTEESDDAALNLAPMIDVVFLLLIFFMVATTFIDKEKEIGIDLPQAEAGEETGSQDELVINLLRDGTVKMNGQVLDPEEGLERALERIARTNPDIPVTLRGDKDVAWQSGVGVIDTCTSLGFTNVGLATVEER